MMFVALLLALFSGAAHAVAVRPSVTGVEGADSVHLLFGEDGEDVASCVPTTGGWSCSGGEIDGIIDAYLLIDTDLVDQQAEKRQPGSPQQQSAEPLFHALALTLPAISWCVE